MGIQETVKKQEAKLAAKAEGQQKQPSTQSHPPAQSVIDMQTLRQMIENVVRAELQDIRIEQPQPLDMQVVQHAVRSVIRAELQAMRDEQPRSQQAVLDMQAVHHAVQSVVRAELQTIQTTLTIMANAIQAQTAALMCEGDEENQEQDEPLPTASPRRTGDTEEDTEDEKVSPSSDEDEDVALDEEREPGEDEDTEGDVEGYQSTNTLPRPLSPTHKLRRVQGPGMLLLGGVHPTHGVRRWEPYSNEV